MKKKRECAATSPNPPGGWVHTLKGFGEAPPPTHPLLLEDRRGVHALGRPLTLVQIGGDGAPQLAGQEDHQLVGAGQAVTGLEAGPGCGTGGVGAELQSIDLRFQLVPRNLDPGSLLLCHLGLLAVGEVGGAHFALHTSAHGAVRGGSKLALRSHTMPCLEVRVGGLHAAVVGTSGEKIAYTEAH